jgi:hypothetical protein
MKLKIIFATIASAMLATSVYATPFDQAAMLKACAMDHTYDTSNLTWLMTKIGAVQKGEVPKITPVTIRKDDVDKDGHGDYELVLALDYGHGRVKATALITCTYMPQEKPPRVESWLAALMMTDPTLYVFDATGNSEPPSELGNRGKIWRQYKIKTYDATIFDHSF